eukprot:CAMPEP_0196211830 /NCGR_PEP_ID=MMETSP0912-20130531/18934_1 /TAXON_ID=49265 /ORGANISM="Thalassiosira rotula, Strain GSO102" /LENGTH=48 /DNA_ID= /DNA_START= /DNA_END= /DNA_ORIENTATION=
MTEEHRNVLKYVEFIVDQIKEIKDLDNSPRESTARGGCDSFHEEHDAA